MTNLTICDFSQYLLFMDYYLSLKQLWVPKQPTIKIIEKDQLLSYLYQKITMIPVLEEIAK
jgi:hypothetical protein